MYDYKDKSEWAADLESINATRKRAPWEMARRLLWGIETYCTGDRDCVIDLYDEMSEQLEVNRKTLQNYASVARRFAPDQVRDRLEIGHHIAVVAMPLHIANFWLDQAEAGAWSVMKLRVEIRKAAQTPSEEDDEDLETMRGQVVAYLNYHGIDAQGSPDTLSMGFPDGRFVIVGTTGKLEWQIT